MFELKGVNVALATPFTKDSVDEEAFRNLIHYCKEQGVHGIVPCGSTGEFSSMTFEEKKRAIEIAVEEAQGMNVIAGTGDSGTDKTITMTRAAQDIGADACLVVTPFYMKPADKGMYEHFATLEESVELPIVLYNIPPLTGVTLPWKVVEDLAELEGIVGIKDSSGNMSYIMTLLEKVSSHINVVCGWDEIVLPSLAAGANGMILASANIMGDYWVKIYNAMQKKEYEKAVEIQRKIQKLARIICATGALGTKAGLNYLGVKVGKCRKPLMIGDTLSYENKEEIRIELEKLGKIKPEEITFKLEGKEITSRFTTAGITPAVIDDFSLKIGEALCGEGSEVAHIDLLIGERKGPVGEAYAMVLASDKNALQAILEPNVLVKPNTLIIPTVKMKDMRHASIVYGPAQAGVAKAVADSVQDGILPEEVLLIVNVFVHPSASKRKQVYINNYKATRHAIRRAMEGRPTTEEIMEVKDNARHPFRYSP
jgi:4-hydroxy-tetrahydrodipicolinate synthase